MSISRLQEKLFGKGCGTAILLGCAAVMGGLVFQYFGQAEKFNNPGQSQTKTQDVIATVGGVPVTQDMVDEGVQRVETQYGLQAAQLTPAITATITQSALEQLLQQAALATVAAQNGIVISDDVIHTALKNDIDQIKTRQMVQMEASKVLRPGATDKEFYEAFKKQTGKDFGDLVKQQQAQIDEDLKDPAKRKSVIASFIGPILTEALKSKQKLSDAQIRATFDRDTYKRIFLMEHSATGKSIDVLVAAVEKDLKGGLSFEAAMDRYSEEPPMPKKKVSDNTTVLTGSELMADPQLHSLSSLKPGQTSNFIKVPGGKAMYKLISVTNSAPSDFQKNIARYRSQVLDQYVNVLMTGQSHEIVASKTEWKSSGYRALYDLTNVIGNDQKSLQTAFEEAQKAVEKNSGFDSRVAALAEYAAFDRIWNAPGADQTKLRPQRIEILNSYLQGEESFDLRKELVTLYAAEHNGKEAAENLLEAARQNNSVDASGQRQFQDVAGLMVSLKASHLLTSDMEKEITDEQSRWQNDKAESDKAEAARKAEEDAERKKAAAEARSIPKVKPESSGAGSASSSSNPNAPNATGIPGVTEPAVPAGPGGTTKSSAPSMGGSSASGAKKP